MHPGLFFQSRSGLFITKPLRAVYYKAAQGCLLQSRSGLFIEEPLRAVY
jgi:hypothetical protein